MPFWLVSGEPTTPGNLPVWSRYVARNFLRSGSFQSPYSTTDALTRQVRGSKALGSALTLRGIDTRMLRENSKILWFGWMGTYGAIAGITYAFLFQIPRFAPETSGESAGNYLSVWIGLGFLVALGWPAILRSVGVFKSQRRVLFLRQVGRMALGHGLGAIALAAAAFTLHAPMNPTFPLALAGILLSFQVLMHIAIFSVLHGLRKRGRNSRNVMILGSGPRALAAQRTIDAHPEWGYQILGFLDEPDSAFDPAVSADSTHTFSEFPEIVRTQVVDEVLIACPRSMIGNLDEVVGTCMTIGIEVTMLTDLFGAQLPPAKSGAFGDVNTLSFAPVHHSPTQMAFKRGFDLIGASVGIAVALPMIAIAATVIRLTSAGPVFFKQTRSGRNGRSFEMIKLRTMTADAEKKKADLLALNELDGPVFKISNDPRITPVGRLLRKFSIDELPQFWNVIRGDMSLVGPRPPTPDEVMQYTGSERRRLSMRPGLTCLWQVSGRNQIGFDDWMKLDLEYIDDWSLVNDAQILARTIPAVLLGRGAA